MSDAAVQAKTGKTWPEWFALMDAEGCAGMPHKAIAEHLYSSHGVPGWWCQNITVAYERARGLREKFQKCDGRFSASASKTIGAPVEALFAAWTDDELRRQWLDADITIRKATPHKSVRITWSDGNTSVEVNLWPKGENRSQAAVEHSKLDGAADVLEKKAYWSDRLNQLKTLLESPECP
jgi:hypothetical protein